jgi:RHS repeat-associated protein
MGSVASRRDFRPFGEEVTADGTYRTANLVYTSTDNIRQKFTGYQKDEETGLDFAEARMYENRHGRFTAVDPLLASGKSANPQSFNRYVYVLNEPVKLKDPKGLQASAPAEDVVVKIYTIIDKAGRDISTYFNRLFNATRDERAQAVMEATNSQLDNTNYQRARWRLDATTGNVQVDNPYPRLIGNKGPTVDSVVQGMTDSYDTAFKIGEANLAFQTFYTGAVTSFLPSSGSNISTNLGTSFFGSTTAASEEPLSIMTPRGPLFQSDSPEALAAREVVSEGAPLFKIGTMDESFTNEAQFWSLENPLTTPNYAQNYGLPGSKPPNFVQSGFLKPGQGFITKPADAIGQNSGGAIEVVTNPCAVRICYFHTFK